MSLTFLWRPALAVVSIAANSVPKPHATGGCLGLLAGALVMFCIGNTLMVQVMRGEGLGMAIGLPVVAVMPIAFPQGGER